MPQKIVDLDRCTCWAVARKRWRNTSPYPCIHVRRSTKTRLPAYVHGCISLWPLSRPFSPRSYMYVHIRSHLHVCMRREACMQSAEIPPAGLECLQ